MNSTPLITHFSRYWSLNDEEQVALVTRLTEKKVKRRQFILQEGDICKHYTFIVEGCFKMYKVDEKGHEHNLQFAIENEWITDIGSFHTQKPSELYIEALEKSTLLQISHADLIHLYINYAVFDRNFRVLIENAFIALQKRVLQNISASAETKYLSFLEDFPHLVHRISNVQIASYLGITPEFLSKLRKTLTQRKMP